MLVCCPECLDRGELQTQWQFVLTHLLAGSPELGGTHAKTATEYSLLPDKPLGELVHVRHRHPIDQTRHGLVTVHPVPVFLQGIFLPRKPAHNPRLNRGVVGI